ncbi:MAG: DoxX family protein [Sphingobacteriales bacterium]|nr:MAG: DoxX family protein [Sphingobacteriales bacterium]TAF82819.1 MAG: DoxX family protein [Sphingobacteriales bacterium]
MINNKLTILTKLFVSLLFIFSGLIKLNDPLGFSYKLEEYFEVFHITFLSPLAVSIAVLLCALEVILGIFLIIGYYTKKVIWALLLLILFFTFLTFFSAYFDVVKTCGCFGDAIALTPWQSFGKDIILLLAILFLFYQRKLLPHKTEKLFISISAISFTFLLGIYTYNFLPIIDFLPYKIGANLSQLTKLPANAQPDEYQILYTLQNLKTTQTKIITDKEYIKSKIYEDKNWILKTASPPKLVKKGDQIVIKDLNLYDAGGVSYTSEIIENPYYTLIAVAYNVDNTHVKALGNINALAINAIQDFNIRAILLTTNSATEATKFAKNNKLVFDIFYADAVPLKSMVRSNPGLILLKNGVIINKWSGNNLPSTDELNKKYFGKN